jgi:hypothetical protein
MTRPECSSTGCFGGRAEIGLLERSVIEPDDGIEARIALGDLTGRPIDVAHDERACGVEADCGDGFGGTPGLLHRLLRTAMQTAAQMSSESCSA